MPHQNFLKNFPAPRRVSFARLQRDFSLGCSSTHATAGASGIGRTEFSYCDSADKPLLKYFSFLLRPLFQLNHDYVMKKGEEGLKRQLRWVTES